MFWFRLLGDVHTEHLRSIHEEQQSFTATIIYFTLHFHIYAFNSCFSSPRSDGPEEKNPLVRVSSSFVSSPPFSRKGTELEWREPTETTSQVTLLHCREGSQD